MPVEHLILDLDETLYPPTSQLWPRIRKRIDDYLIVHAGVVPAHVGAERKRLFDTYGTTLRGLAIEKEVDLDKYLEYVHDVPVEHLITRNLDLVNILDAVLCDIYIFSNASRRHAERVLEALDISRYFSQIISVEDMHPWCKPQIHAFEIALDIIGESDYSTCLFIDDSKNNIETAMKLGIQTVHITTDSKSKLADFNITEFCQIKPILQQLNCI